MTMKLNPRPKPYWTAEKVRLATLLIGIVILIMILWVYGTANPSLPSVQGGI